MYGGPPMQGGGLPPFPPNYLPNGTTGPPPNLPPFRPPPGFLPPPFPPNFSPNGIPGTPYGGPLPAGVRPPPSFTPRPSHPGLGLPPPAAGLPIPPHAAYGASPSSSIPPGFRKEVKTTSVFVGSIAPGIGDSTMQDLLNACGPLHELKRVTGANGKPQPFGFALFESPEVVMRCIRCLNGIELPDMTPEGRSRPPKPLVVKVDDKTREFLEEFEQTLGRSEDDESDDAIARKAVAHIVALLTDPKAQAPDLEGGPVAPTRIPVIVPAHLQDLREGDLPENQRVAVLDQIAIFRENAMKREMEKKKMEDEKERYKSSQATASPANRPQAGPSEGYGYGNRAFQQPPVNERQWGRKSPSTNGTSLDKQDPQGYFKPVDFVAAQAPESREQTQRTDEEEEELQRQRLDKERALALRERERRVETREKHRIENLNREMAHRKQQADIESRNKKQMRETLESWNDDEKIERGREPFYIDRLRWRIQRQTARMREYQDDVRDRQMEEDEVKALEKESEEFLKRQMTELAELEQKQRRAGLLTEDAAPIKLSISAPAAEPKKEEKPDTNIPRPTVNFDAEDDDESTTKKRRTFVKLEYEGDGLTEAEQKAKRNARLLDIRSGLPSERKRVWATRIEWAAISENLLKDKIRPFVNDKIAKYLGDVDEDLSDFTVKHVRDKKGPEDLVDGLEPVLDEEATSLVTQLWRLLAFESAAYVAGLDTGTMGI